MNFDKIELKENKPIYITLDGQTHGQDLINVYETVSLACAKGQCKNFFEVIAVTEFLESENLIRLQEQRLMPRC
jgi:hypothetical protein